MPLVGLEACCTERTVTEDFALMATSSSDAGGDAEGDAATGTENTPTPPPAADGGTTSCMEECQRRALNRFDCSGSRRVTACGDAVVDGGAGVRCTFVVTSCPQPPGVVCGRRPEGFVEQGAVEGASELGALFARMAELEAASVPAFDALARELRAHGAPASLVRAARRALADEVRHTRMMTALARRFGARPARAAVEPRALRPLEEVARENSVEGCVRETFGALVAAYQARAAQDPAVRAAMAVIARDEARHAALAWRVAAWAEPRLDPSAAARVAAAREQAVRELADAATTPVAAALAEQAGMPGSPQARALVAHAEALIWSRRAGAVGQA